TTGGPRHTPETRGDQRRGRAWGLGRQGPGEDRLRGGCDRVFPAGGGKNLAAVCRNRMYRSDFKGTEPFLRQELHLRRDLSKTVAAGPGCYHRPAPGERNPG